MQVVTAAAEARDELPPAELAAGWIGILGAGRQALETAGYCAELGLRIAFFGEDADAHVDRAPDPAFGAPLLSFDELRGSHVPMITAVGSPALRRAFVAGWSEARYRSVISPHAWLAADVTVGPGSTIAARACLNRLVRLGSHVLVNVAAVLSHDVEVGDFATISPAAAIGGGVSIGAGAFLGIGCTVRDHVRIGSGAVIGAGAVVVTDVPADTTVVGVPARPLRRRERP